MKTTTKLLLCLAMLVACLFTTIDAILRGSYFFAGMFIFFTLLELIACFKYGSDLINQYKGIV